MINKYINILKKSVIFLIIALIIISYSFGMTYSNFIYKSDSHRAVEMFTSKLDYELTINNSKSNLFTLKPGNNMLHINIKSLNNIDSYYKLVYECENINISYYEINDNNILKSNEDKTINVIVFNKSNNNITIDFSVVGGFITNNYSDVKVPNGYKEIVNNISIGSIVTIGEYKYRLLSINDDGSYELLSDVLNETTLNGASSYNKLITSINNLNAPFNSITYRSVNLSDIRKYTLKDIVEYNDTNYYRDAFYPSLWEKEDSIINNIKNDNPLSREEELEVDENHKYTSSIIVKGIKINNIKFIDDRYEDIFLKDDYLLATRYNTAYDENASWGVLSIKEGRVTLNELYNSLNNEYTINGNIRIYAVMSNKLDLFNTSI